MSALLIGLLLLVSGAGNAPPPDPCGSLYASMDENYRALLKHTRTNLDEFVSLTQQARRCYGDVLSEQVRTLYYREAYARAMLRQYPETVELLDEFFDRFGDQLRPDKVWWMYERRGLAHYYLGHLNESARDYALAVTYSEGTPPIRRTRTLLDFANVLQRLRDFSSAQDVYLQVDQLLQTIDPSTPGWKGSRVRSLNARADLILERTDVDTPAGQEALREGIEMLQESLALQRDEPPGINLSMALILLSEAYLPLDAPDTSYAYIRRAVEVARELDDGHWRYVSIHKLGRFFIRTRALDRAEATLLDALAMVDLARHADHKRRILTDMGRLYELRREFTKAESFYEQAIAVTEEYRHSLRATEWSAAAFSEWLDPYRGLIRVLLAQQRYEAAFEALEMTRARHLQDLRMQSQLLGRLSLTHRARFDSLTTALSETFTELADDALSITDRNALHARQARLDAARRALIDLDQRFDVPSLDTLQQTLAERGQVVISYFIDASGNDPTAWKRPLYSYAFVLTPDTLAAVPLDIDEQGVEDLLKQVSPHLTSGQVAVTFNTRQYDLAALYTLYDVLFAPVAPYLQEQDRLVIIPDGPLFMLPFGMLVAAETAPYQYQQAPFLLRKHPISVELATTLVLHEQPAPPASSYDVVAFGKVDFEDAGPDDAFRGPDAQGARLIDLPAVAEEIDALGKRFRHALTRMDREATEGSFLELAPQARVLHLASHTLLRPASPLHNAIVLSSDPSDDRHDGILYLHEIQRQHLGAELVVLSGCGTARGVLRPGEGMAGLQYAFRAMGVQSSLATSWYVEDKTSVPLMDAFYRHLQAGLPKDIALQRAQLEVLDRAGEQKSSPFFWAAPVLYGSTAPLALAGKPFAWGCLAPFGVVGLILLLVFARRRHRPGRAGGPPPVR